MQRMLFQEFSTCHDSYTVFQLCHILFYKLKVKTFLQRSTWLQLLQVSSHVCPPCIFGTETSFLHSMLSTFLGHRQEYMVLTAWVCFSSSLFSVSRSILWGGAVNLFLRHACLQFPEPCTTKQVQHTWGIFSLSAFAYPNTDNQDKPLHMKLATSGCTSSWATNFSKF